jgi:hypothetical protein
VNWTKVLEQVSEIKVKSITDSLFRYGALLLTLGTIAAICKATQWVLVALITMGAIFCFFGLGFYWYFSIKKPDYLRSESFQLRKQSIEILGDKDNNANPNLQNIVLITSPYKKSISDTSGRLNIGKNEE